MKSLYLKRDNIEMIFTLLRHTDELQVEHWEQDRGVREVLEEILLMQLFTSTVFIMNALNT